MDIKGSGKWIFLAIVSVLVVVGLIVKKKLGQADTIHDYLN
jgi:hypothetical protein